MAIEESQLTKGQLRKLNGLRKSVGDALGDEVFAKWVARQAEASAPTVDPVGYAAGRLSVEVNARGLVAHEDTAYEEWGFSGSIAYTPSEDGRGLSMRLGSAWGATQSGVQSLWSRQDASGLVSNAAFEAAQRYQVELRYGLDGKTGRARWEPFVGVESAAGASRALRLGVKLTSGRRLDVGLELGRRQGRPGAAIERRNSAIRRVKAYRACGDLRGGAPGNRRRTATGNDGHYRDGGCTGSGTIQHRDENQVELQREHLGGAR